MIYRFLLQYLARTLAFSTLWGATACFATGDWFAPVALQAGADGKLLYAAVDQPNSLVAIDVATGQSLRSIALPAPPTGMALLGEGRQLIVTCGQGLGSILLCDANTGQLREVAAAVHSPTAPCSLPDGTGFFVCDRFRDLVLAFDASGKKLLEMPAPRQPVVAAATPDGQTLIVAGLLPGGASDSGYAASAVALYDAASLHTKSTVRLPNGSNAVRDVCVSPDGHFAYVSHVLARYQLPTTQLERGWMNTNALSVIDLASGKFVNTVLLDEVDLGAANPWGVACTSDGKQLCVTHAGSHEVSVIDRVGLHDKLQSRAGQGVAPPNDLAFLNDLRRRAALPGNGPRAVAMVGSTLYVGQHFSGYVAVIDCESPEADPRTITLGQVAPPDEARRGKILFHDANRCFQKWQSCASCHPSDGRADALNWDLLNDGLGNAKNTKSLLYSHRTPPAMATGVRATANMAVRAGLRHIQFCIAPEEDAVAIDRYLESLRPVASPHLMNDGFKEAAARGRKVFEAAHCARCHSGPLFTDQRLHDVGTGRRSEVGTQYDTPSLSEVWRTAPYLHDGRAATVREMLTTHNPEDRHGVTSAISEKELDDLVAFVLSL